MRRFPRPFGGTPITLLGALATLAAAAGGCDPASRISFDVAVVNQQSQADPLLVAKSLAALDSVASRWGFSGRSYTDPTTGKLSKSYELDELEEVAGGGSPRRRQFSMHAAPPSKGGLRITVLELISWPASPRLRQMGDDLHRSLIAAVGPDRVTRRK